MNINRKTWLKIMSMWFNGIYVIILLSLIGGLCEMILYCFGCDYEKVSGPFIYFISALAIVLIPLIIGYMLEGINRKRNSNEDDKSS